MITSKFNNYLPVIFFFLCLFLYTQLTGPLPFSITSTVTNKTDTFTSTGEGKVAVKPDIAYVTVGVEAQARTVKEAQDQLNSTINTIVESVNSQGVDGNKDMQTESYSIHPNYDFSNGIQRITGYVAQTNLRIKVRNIDLVNNVIDASTAAGATNVGNVVFDVDDREKLEDQARKEAVAQAKKKASEAAKTAGFKLGKIINYSESTDDVIQIPVYDRAISLESKAEPVQTDIQTGTEEVRMVVNISYQIN